MRVDDGDAYLQMNVTVGAGYVICLALEFKFADLKLNSFSLLDMFNVSVDLYMHMNNA